MIWCVWAQKKHLPWGLSQTSTDTSSRLPLTEYGRSSAARHFHRGPTGKFQGLGKEKGPHFFHSTRVRMSSFFQESKMSLMPLSRASKMGLTFVGHAAQIALSIHQLRCVVKIMLAHTVWLARSPWKCRVVSDEAGEAGVRRAVPHHPLDPRLPVTGNRLRYILY